MPERDMLLAKLGVVAPALAENEIVPILTHLLFNDGKLLAYNERIAISAPFESDFSGAVPGKFFLTTLNTVQARKIKLEASNSHTLLTAGFDKTEMGLMPTEQFNDVFKMPAKPRNGASVDTEFMQAIDDCLQSVEQNSTIPDKLGITAIPERNGLELYSTNSITLTRALLPANTAFRKRCILGADFCRELLRLGKDAERRTLAVHDDHALFSADDVLLFGKLLASTEQLNYKNAVSRNLPNNFPRCMPRISEKERARLRISVELAANVSNVGSEPHSRIEVQGGEVSIHTSSRLGQHRVTRVPLKNHPQTKCRVMMSNVARAYDRYEDVMFSENCVVLSKPNTIHLISAHVGHE